MLCVTLSHASGKPQKHLEQEAQLHNHDYYCSRRWTGNRHVTHMTCLSPDELNVASNFHMSKGIQGRVLRPYRRLRGDDCAPLAQSIDFQSILLPNPNFVCFTYPSIGKAPVICPPWQVIVWG